MSKHCRHTCAVEAPVEQVWALLRDFHDLSWAPNVVDDLQTGGTHGPHAPGATRVVNGVIHETLIEIDDLERRLRYRIVDGPGPLSARSVTNYVGTVSVVPIPARDTSFVTWSAAWEDGEDGLDEFVRPVYAQLLADLRAHFGA